MLSFWEKNIFSKSYDVGIIGAGFAGSWLAYELLLKNPNLNIIILEKGILPQGASTKNAGFACFGSASELLENIEQIGLEKTMALTEKRFKGVQKIKNTFGSQIDFNACTSFELFEDNLEYEKTLAVLSELNSALEKNLKISSHFSISKAVISNFGFENFKNGIENKQEGSIHSLKLLDALHKQIQAKGAKIYFNQALISFEDEGTHVAINTPHFGEIKVKHLSICTNAFTKALNPDLQITPGRGQMLVTKPIDNLKINGTFHFDKGYFYFRNYENRILFGGGRNLAFEEETTSKFGENKFLLDSLKSYLETHILPNTPFEIDQTWSGIMAFNEEKEPISKIVSSRLSYNVCMNGMGVALTPTLGEELASQINKIF